MEIDEFKTKLIKGLTLNNIMKYININDEKIYLLYTYMKYVIEKNKYINLTSIVNEDEFIYKHYIDSLYVTKYIKNSGKLLDIGTGAGFPGLPLLIVFDNLEVTFLDSRNKKLKIIEEFINKYNLKNAKFLHSRIEDLKNKEVYLKSFNFITTRAVSSIENVINYTIPYLKKEGIGIAMRGQLKEEEKDIIKNNVNIKSIDIYSIINNIQKTEYKRSILLLKNT